MRYVKSQRKHMEIFVRLFNFGVHVSVLHINLNHLTGFYETW
jgi:hypothetical protein